MAKVYSPVANYSGITAGVKFVKGVGECSHTTTLDWFRRRGYRVVEDKPIPVATVIEPPVEQAPAVKQEPVVEVSEDTAIEPKKPRKSASKTKKEE